MATTQYVYLAQLFHPREQSGRILLFVAPAAELRGWAGVPRKAFDYQHGFQRTLQPKRVSEVADFFSNKENISPTAVVIGFLRPVKIEPLEGLSFNSDTSQLVKLTVEIDDFDSKHISDLAKIALDHLKSRLDTNVVDQIEANLDDALEKVIQMESSDEIDQSFESMDDNGPDDTLDTANISYLADFYTRLLGLVKGKINWPDDEKPLREILYSLVKPGIIVDGQHRIFGAATVDESLRLAVCAVPDANWPESVFQFVVINQKAQPIKPAFLNAIIATSLNLEEISLIYKRLGDSNIDVGKAELMERLNTDLNSPFRQMIDFEVDGSPGFMKFPGMNNLVKDFTNIAKLRPTLVPKGGWQSVEGDALAHFFAFWTGVKNYFEGLDSSLWQRPTDTNTNNLLKIVTLQEMQKMMLALWVENKIVINALEETTSLAKAYWADFPAGFFKDEWKSKGLQTATGRDLIAKAIKDTRTNSVLPGFNYRKLKLFTG